MKKTFQDVLKDIENNLIGKELHGISGNAATFSVSEVDYANEYIVLNVQGKRRTWTFERLDKVWKEMYYRPAANVEIVFGGSGSSRNQVETIYASLGYVEWLHVRGKKCVAYVGTDTHPYGILQHMDDETEAKYQKLMDAPNPQNPLLEPEELLENAGDIELDEYQKAAKVLKDYVLEEGFEFSETPQDIASSLEYFQQTYAPEVLATLNDAELLTKIFYSSGDNTNALCCYLEMNKECRMFFGSISGGSAYKFGLFQKKDTGIWTTGSPQKPQELSEEDALVLGKEIRDALVNGVQVIREASLDSLEAYEKLDQDLKAALGDQFYNWGWIHKYLSIICNEKLSCFHSTDWQLHVLRALRIRPSECYYARSGQICMVQNHLGWYYWEFFQAFLELIGEQKQFVRLGTSDEDKNYSAEWSKRGAVGIGWPALGDLNEYVAGESIDRKLLQDKLKEVYYKNDERSASRKAGEIVRFYRCDSNTIFVLMDGERLIALADNVGNNYYDPSTSMANQKEATWRFVFGNEDKLPEKTEGKLTTCYQLSNEDNLLFLYDRYYYGEESDSNLQETETTEITEDEEDAVLPIRFETGLQTVFEGNRILFGAPGTGKSFTLNQQRKALLGDDNELDYERVTFHPDYSYANFVGTYKPVPCKDKAGNDAITYKYVPGPFMRVYVNALKNSRTENPKPFLLIIEEINRANVAAVFGDIFQLLDRGDNNVSEYPIQASEDIKKYLSDELNINSELCAKIRIPDNMFIWATMNSADQGVFPMDTAFKRRWDFTYLGINDSEERLVGKTVVLGSGDTMQKVEWNKLRRDIKNLLANEKINEDKQLGPYFIAKNIVVPTDGDEIDRKKFIRTFKNKVIMYLFEDAAKQKRPKLFEGCFASSSRYSEICREFDEKGIGIFYRDIQLEAEPEDLKTKTEAENE